VLEVGIIDAQAARGLTSSFNVTALDATLFSLMASPSWCCGCPPWC